MANAAVELLLEKMSTVLTTQLNLISGAENNLQQLMGDLDVLKSFLQNAAKKPMKLELLREIERQIREVVYDAEYTIDSCLTQAAKANDKRFFLRTLKKVDNSLPLLVNSLREDKVAPIIRKIDMYKNTQFDEGSGADVEETSTRVRKPQLIRQDNVIGFEDEEETIVKYLKEQKPELDVISIIGMPGLGKTTLAWKIFQSPVIQFQFPTRIWVNISQLLNRRAVLLNILKQFTAQDLSSLSDHDLDVMVRRRLEDVGRFLLVLDDVYSVEIWNAIKDVLPKRNMISKVIMTSRYSDVGIQSNHTREPHKLRFMTNDESWELLQLEVFGKLDDCPPKLKGTGYHTAMQCNGLPLSIVVIGGILFDLLSSTGNIDITESWLEVADSMSMFVKNNKEYDISYIVGLSYNRLPDDLRDCFIYLGVFPEDYEISAWTLTRLWIAEGLIMHKDGKTLEKTAEENLKELIERNLVMVDKTNPKNEVKTCRVHHVVRAFCTIKAEEQNLYQEIRMSKEGFFHPSVDEIEKVHEIEKYNRLCIHSDVQEFLSKRPKGRSVRSFLSFNRVPIDLNPKYTAIIPDGFELLKVLDSKSIKFMQFPKGVTKLIHLRYITMFGEDLDFLPKAISELWNLQTIVIETNSGSLIIEANIWKMLQLRHLKTKAAIVLAKGDGDGGENLQTLSRLSPDHCTEDVFKRARNLKTLGIRGNLNTLSSGGKSLEKLRRLDKLKLVNDRSSAGQLHGLPQSGFFPECLSWLTISGTSLDWTHMSALAKIVNLRILKLKDKAFVGRSWEASGLCFQLLHYLLIEDTDLVVWDVSADYFPSLKSLVLKHCENLVEIPMGVSKSLEVLDIDGLGKSAVVSAINIEADKRQMQEESVSRWGGRFKLRIGPGCNQ